MKHSCNAFLSLLSFYLASPLGKQKKVLGWTLVMTTLEIPKLSSLASLALRFVQARTVNGLCPEPESVMLHPVTGNASSFHGSNRPFWPHCGVPSELVMPVLNQHGFPFKATYAPSPPLLCGCVQSIISLHRPL